MGKFQRHGRTTHETCPTQFIVFDNSQFQRLQLEAGPSLQANSFELVLARWKTCCRLSEY
jgi:hypothetical protein